MPSSAKGTPGSATPSAFRQAGKAEQANPRRIETESPDRLEEHRAERSRQDSDGFLDPLCRALATGIEWRPPEQAPCAQPDPVARAARVSLENVIDKLVRKIAWSGNGRAGTVRIELGAGALSGATLLVQADGPEVRVTLDLPPGADAAGWRQRLSERFSARGLRIAELEIR